MTLNDYKDIMRQLYIDKQVLSMRIKAFREHQSEATGTTSCISLFHDYHKIIRMLIEPLDLNSINCTFEKIKKYDKDGDGYLTFFDFNKFINELIKENI